MPSINQYIDRPVAFDPEAISAMDVAYKNALASFPTSPPKTVREVIAVNIIRAARKGKRDPHMLCEIALKALRPEVVR